MNARNIKHNKFWKLHLVVKLRFWLKTWQNICKVNGIVYLTRCYRLWFVLFCVNGTHLFKALKLLAVCAISLTWYWWKLWLNALVVWRFLAVHLNRGIAGVLLFLRLAPNLISRPARAVSWNRPQWKWNTRIVFWSIDIAFIETLGAE